MRVARISQTQRNATVKQSLLDITDDMRALDELLIELDGDISDPAVMEVVDMWFAELDKNLLQKVDGYATYITELQWRAKARKEEADRLAGRARIDANNADYLKQRLHEALVSRGMTKLETARYKVTVCKNGGKQPLDIHEPEAVPQNLKRHIPERWEPDADLIRDAIAQGLEVAGVTVEERGTHLRIK